MAIETRQNGEAIRVFREIRGLSRNQLADRLEGISYPYLANIENEHKSPPSEILHRIAIALDVPVGAILRRPIYTEHEQAS